MKTSIITSAVPPRTYTLGQSRAIRPKSDIRKRLEEMEVGQCAAMEKDEDETLKKVRASAVSAAMNVVKSSKGEKAFTTRQTPVGINVYRTK